MSDTSHIPAVIKICQNQPIFIARDAGGDTLAVFKYKCEAVGCIAMRAGFLWDLCTTRNIRSNFTEVVAPTDDGDLIVGFVETAIFEPIFK